MNRQGKLGWLASTSRPSQPASIVDESSRPHASSHLRSTVAQLRHLHVGKIGDGYISSYGVVNSRGSKTTSPWALDCTPSGEEGEVTRLRPKKSAVLRLLAEGHEVGVGDVAIFVEVKAPHQRDEHLVVQLHIVSAENILQRLVAYLPSGGGVGVGKGGIQCL